MISKSTKIRFYTSLFLFFLIYLMISSKFFLAYTLIILGVISLIEFLSITKKIFSNFLYLIIVNSIFILYIFIFCLSFFLLENSLQFKLIIFILLAGCIASDIGGFVFGKIFKGVRLTKISPKKTISGSIGSIILSSIVMLSLIYYFTKMISLNFLMISIFTSIFCQLGDLLFSYLKRKAKLKDTGNFLPGHGGVLDRVDGILIGVPFGLFTILIIF